MLCGAPTELWEVLPTEGPGEGGVHPFSPAASRRTRGDALKPPRGKFRVGITETPNGESGNPARESQNH